MKEEQRRKEREKKAMQRARMSPEKKAADNAKNSCYH
jgi:hypothetical protein